MDYDDAKRDVNLFYEPREETGDFFIQSLPWCQTLCLFSSFFSSLIRHPLLSISHLSNRNGYDNENETQSVEYYKFIYLFIHQLNT